MNLNQAAVGRLMGSMVESPQRMVSDIECGACEEPSFRLVERYAAALGLMFKLVHLDGSDLEEHEL
jgi:transcriptional regulator with XRE-family HTH domain